MKRQKVNGYTIKTLGEFEVMKGNEVLTSVSASSKKIWELYKFMLTFKDRKFTPESLNDQVWISESYTDPRGTLRRQMHRMRQILKEDNLPEQEWSIRYENGYYFWNPAIDYTLDADLFQKYLTTVVCEHPDDLSCCLKAIDLYKGDYLPDLYEQHWVFSIRTHYRRLFLSALNDSIKYLYDLEDYTKVLDLCQQAIQIDNYEERFHIEYMRALTKMDRQKEALGHYDQITSFYYKELGLKPSDEMRLFYQSITRTPVSNDVDFIESLTRTENYKDAYYCDPEVFRSICELEKRKSERHDRPFIIGVLKLTPIPGNDMAREQYRIRHLKMHLLGCLRKGDVLTLWNHYRFLILISDMSEESVQSMISRIISTYDQSDQLTADFLRQL